MDLWIRSQDKEKLLKCDDIVIKNHRYDTMDEYGNRCINYKGYEIVGYFDKNTENETLGTYKTKERALEVLDKIQSCIETNKMFDLYSRTGVYPNEFNKKYNLVTVYQMPID